MRLPNKYNFCKEVSAYIRKKRTFNYIKFNHNNNYDTLLETTLWERTALLDGSEWDCYAGEDGSKTNKWLRADDLIG